MTLAAPLQHRHFGLDSTWRGYETTRGLLAGEVEHRDFVLSERQREDSIILCQSRAADENGVIEIDL